MSGAGSSSALLPRVLLAPTGRPRRSAARKVRRQRTRWVPVPGRAPPALRWRWTLCERSTKPLTGDGGTAATGATPPDRVPTTKASPPIPTAASPATTRKRPAPRCGTAGVEATRALARSVARPTETPDDDPPFAGSACNLPASMVGVAMSKVKHLGGHVARLGQRRASVGGRGIDRVREFDGGLVAIRALGREGLHADFGDGDRHVASHVTRRAVHSRHDLRDGLTLGLAPEQAAPGQRLPEHDPRRKYVGPSIDLAGEHHLLGRHVGDLALQTGALGGRQARFGLRDPEVGDARDAVRAHEHVLRRNVAVNQTRASVRRSPSSSCAAWSPSSRVDQDAQDDGDRQALLGSERRAQDGVERVALDVLHHQAQALFVALDGEGGDHVGVADARGEPRLVEEHRDEVGLVGDVRVHHLERHQSFEAAFAEDLGEIHRRHASLGKRTYNFVPTRHRDGS